MTKKEFLIESAIYYYIDETKEEIFNYLPKKAKTKVINIKIIEDDYLKIWEIVWISKNNRRLIKLYIKHLIERGVNLSYEELEAIEVEWAIYWFELVYKDCKKEGELFYWKKEYESNYIKYKAKMRDKKIDQILND